MAFPFSSWKNIYKFRRQGLNPFSSISSVFIIINCWPENSQTEILLFLLNSLYRKSAVLLIMEIHS